MRLPRALRVRPGTALALAVLGLVPLTLLVLRAQAQRAASPRLPWHPSPLPPEPRPVPLPEAVPAQPAIRVPRPLEGRYGVMLTIAMLALAPFIVVTTAYALFRHLVATDLGASRTALEVISGEATAGYAFGALLGGDLVQRFRQRSLFLLCEALFVIGCVAAALAQGVVAYGFGRILMGFATGLLLVVALPPVIQNFPARRLPLTVVVVDIGFFGAVCAGPLLGGAVAAGHWWRWFYGGLGALGALAVALALLTLPRRDPPNPGLRFDLSAMLLGLGTTVLPFWAASELTRRPFTSLLFTLPLAVGLACLVALLVTEYVRREPLSPVRQMWTTLPVVGTLTAMAGGGVFVAFLELAELFQMQVLHRGPLATGLLFWPQAVGVLVTAGLLGALLRTRLLPLLILAGMALLLAGGGLLLLQTGRDGAALTLAAAGLLGLGAGATVSPGLYLAGFPLKSMIIGRIFALVELVRSVADYILAPVILRIARDASGHALTAHGIRQGLWVTLLIGAGLLAFGLVLYLIGAPGLPRPDLEAWLGQDEPALPSPKLAAALRRRDDA